MCATSAREYAVPSWHIPVRQASDGDAVVGRALQICYRASSLAHGPKEPAFEHDPIACDFDGCVRRAGSMWMRERHGTLVLRRKPIYDGRARDLGAIKETEPWLWKTN